MLSVLLALLLDSPNILTTALHKMEQALARSTTGAPSRMGNTTNQESSLLDRIPTELRLMIYDEVLRHSNLITRSWCDNYLISRPALISAYPHLRHEMLDMYHQKLLRGLSRYVAIATPFVLSYERYIARTGSIGAMNPGRRRWMWRAAHEAIDVAAKVERVIEREMWDLTVYRGDCRDWERPSLINRWERHDYLYNGISVKHGYPASSTLGPR